MPYANPTLGYPIRTIFHWLALGLMLGIIGSRCGVALGPQGFSDTNMLVLATQILCVGGGPNVKPQCVLFRVAVEYRLTSIFHQAFSLSCIGN